MMIAAGDSIAADIDQFSPVSEDSAAGSLFFALQGAALSLILFGKGLS
ncbi:MAG: hypothetical protein JXB85_06865 [Anaerolineales bacterium]|nr:hypothetical protein [Anaerolineales bacterium]